MKRRGGGERERRDNNSVRSMEENLVFFFLGERYACNENQERKL